MSDPVRQLSFSGGEVAPAMYARTDHVKYETGLRTLRNMICMRHGGVTGRPGTMYVGTTLNGGAQVRLIPFIFNETGNGQSYVLEFGNQYIAFYQNGGVVISAPSTPYTIATPYLQADLSTLRYAQSADVVTIVHANYPPMELKRLAATNWTLTTPTFGAPLAGPTGMAATGTAVAPTPWNAYIVTSVNAQGEESDQFNFASVSNSALAVATSTTPITITWTAVADAIYYKVYMRKDATPNGAGPLGYVGQTSGVKFIDDGLTPDFANVPPLHNDPFQGAGNYPSVVGYTQQRIAYGATTNNPVGFWLSYPGDFHNLDTHIVLEDSDAVIASIAGSEVNAIEAITELKFMLIMTSGAEIYVQGDGNGIVKASAVNASVQSQYGSSTLRPLKVADILLFNQSLGSFIRDFSFDFAIDGYRGNDITVFSSHMFEGYSIVDWDYQKIPDSIVWVVRSDGVLLSCTYIREQQILAWARHDFTNGVVENVCSIPENGQYAVYLSIKRVINGSTVRYIERLSSRIWKGPSIATPSGLSSAIYDPLDATYLDCFASYEGRNSDITDTMRLNGGVTWDYNEDLNLDSNIAFFTSGMVGDTIMLIDPTTGDEIRAQIWQFVNAFRVSVYPNKPVPVGLQNVAVVQWARGVKTVTGLDYLEGQEVSVWADRFVVGSPLNTNISNTYTVTAGAITLDKPYGTIYVGLPMSQDLQTLDIETSFGGTILSKRKRSGRVNIYTYKSRSVFAGSQDPDTNEDNEDDDPLFQLMEQMQEGNRETYDEPPDLSTKQDFITFDTRWNMNGRVFLRNVDPIPFSILSIAPEGEDPAKSEFYKKV